MWLRGLSYIRASPRRESEQAAVLARDGAAEQRPLLVEEASSAALAAAVVTAAQGTEAGAMVRPVGAAAEVDPG